MSTLNAVAEASDLMRVWSEQGAGAATEHLSGIPQQDREGVMLGLVNLLGSVLSLREEDRGVPPVQTLDEIISRPWAG